VFDEDNEPKINNTFLIMWVCIQVVSTFCIWLNSMLILYLLVKANNG